MEIFKELGITNLDILRFKQLMEERAKSRVPNEKFKVVGAAVELAKRIAKDQEGKLSVEYPYGDAVLTLELICFDIRLKQDMEFIELLNMADMFSIGALVDGLIQITFDFKQVFDM